MATTVRSSSKNSLGSGSAVTVTAPAGTTMGDLVIISIHANGVNTISDNNGATPFTADLSNYAPNTVSGETISIYSRRILAGDPSSYAFTLLVAGRWSITAVTFQNPDPTTIYDIAPTSGRTNNVDSPGASSINAPSITTTNDLSIHCAIGYLDDGSGGVTGTPSGYTVQQTAVDQPQSFCTKVISPFGATGTAGFTFSSTTGVMATSFAIKSTANRKVELLTENFDDNSLDLAIWTLYQTGGATFAETNQRAEYQLAATTSGSWSGINSKEFFTLVASSATIQFITATTGNSYLDLTLSNEVLPIVDNFISIGINVGTQKLEAVQEIAGVDSVLASISYNPAVHKFGRLREAAGTVYWDYSTDGLSWTNLWNQAPPVPITNVCVVLDDYEYDGASTPNLHALDNLNIIPSTTIAIGSTLLMMGV